MSENDLYCTMTLYRMRYDIKTSKKADIYIYTYPDMYPPYTSASYLMPSITTHPSSSPHHPHHPSPPSPHHHHHPHHPHHTTSHFRHDKVTCENFSCSPHSFIRCFYWSVLSISMVAISGWYFLFFYFRSTVLPRIIFWSLCNALSFMAP